MSDLNKHKSAALTDGPSRAAARAMLKACAFTDEDLAKPLVGIANTWTEIGPCNFHLRRLAEHVKAGVREAGGTPMEFNTIAVSDGITMGAEGMRASLVSREVIADSIELVTFGHHLDAVVMLCGCDKTIPGTIMALARLNIPGVILYGGSIAPGTWQGQRRHDPGRVRGHRRARRRPHLARRTQGPRGQGLSRRRRLRRPVHGQHDGDGRRVPRRRGDGQRQHPGDGAREGSRRRSRPVASPWICCAAACARATYHARPPSRTPSPAWSRPAARPMP